MADKEEFERPRSESEQHKYNQEQMLREARSLKTADWFRGWEDGFDYGYEAGIREANAEAVSEQGQTKS